jgi:hypothetical protein
VYSIPAIRLGCSHCLAYLTARLHQSKIHSVCLSRFLTYLTHKFRESDELEALSLFNQDIVDRPFYYIDFCEKEAERLINQGHEYFDIHIEETNYIHYNFCVLGISEIKENFVAVGSIENLSFAQRFPLSHECRCNRPGCIYPEPASAVKNNYI